MRFFDKFRSSLGNLGTKLAVATSLFGAAPGCKPNTETVSPEIQEKVTEAILQTREEVKQIEGKKIEEKSEQAVAEISRENIREIVHQTPPSKIDDPGKIAPPPKKAKPSPSDNFCKPKQPSSPILSSAQREYVGPLAAGDQPTMPQEEVIALEMEDIEVVKETKNKCQIAKAKKRTSPPPLPQKPQLETEKTNNPKTQAIAEADRIPLTSESSQKDTKPPKVQHDTTPDLNVQVNRTSTLQEQWKLPQGIAPTTEAEWEDLFAAFDQNNKPVASGKSDSLIIPHSPLPSDSTSLEKITQNPNLPSAAADISEDEWNNLFDEGEIIPVESTPPAVVIPAFNPLDKNTAIDLPPLASTQYTIHTPPTVPAIPEKKEEVLEIAAEKTRHEVAKILLMTGLVLLSLTRRRKRQEEDIIKDKKHEEYEITFDDLNSPSSQDSKNTSTLVVEAAAIDDRIPDITGYDIIIESASRRHQPDPFNLPTPPIDHTKAKDEVKKAVPTKRNFEPATPLPAFMTLHTVYKAQNPLKKPQRSTGGRQLFFPLNDLKNKGGVLFKLDESSGKPVAYPHPFIPEIPPKDKVASDPTKPTNHQTPPNHKFRPTLAFELRIKIENNSPSIIEEITTVPLNFLSQGLDKGN